MDIPSLAAARLAAARPGLRGILDANHTVHAPNCEGLVAGIVQLVLEDGELIVEPHGRGRGHRGGWVRRGTLAFRPRFLFCRFRGVYSCGGVGVGAVDEEVVIVVVEAR